MESSLARRAAPLSCSRIAAPTPVAPGSFELASALSWTPAAGCSMRALVLFPPQPAMNANPIVKAVPVDR